MASAHFRARKQRSGVVRYYAEFYDPARTPTAKSHTLRTADEKRARPADPVALSPRGAVPNAKRFAALFREARELSGIGGDGTPHDLRHAFISWSVNEMNVPLTVVQAMAGHSDIKTTAAYQRVTNVSMLEATTRALRLAGVAPVAPSPAADAVALYLAGASAAGDRFRSASEVERE